MALKHFYTRDIRLDSYFRTPSINSIMSKVDSCQSRTTMTCCKKLLRTQTREKHNEELIVTHTLNSLREPPMIMNIVVWTLVTSGAFK